MTTPLEEAREQFAAVQTKMMEAIQDVLNAPPERVARMADVQITFATLYSSIIHLGAALEKLEKAQRP